MRLAAAVFVLFLLALLPAKGGAADTPPPLVLSGDASDFPLRGHLSRLEDPDGALSFDEVRRSEAFQPRRPDAMERNYTSGAVWYRFTVIREKDTRPDWVLTIGEPFIDDIRVFEPGNDGAYREQQLGRHIPSAELPLAARRHLARLDLPDATPATIFVRLSSRDEIQFQASLAREDSLLFSEVRQATFFGMFFATITFIVVVYLLFGAWLRDGPMLAYAAYLATFILFGSSHTGVIAILFPSAGGSANYLLIGIGVIGNVAALIFMWDRILDLRKTYPAIHRAYMVAGTVALASLATVVTPWYILAVRPTFVATMAVTVISLGLAARLIRRGKGNYLLTYYVVAFSPFLVFSLAHAAEVLFPSALDILLVRQLSTVAMLAHIAILSLALAHRIARVQRDRLRADAEVAATRAAMREHRNFVSMLSHQLRTPMAIILAAIDVFDLKQPASEHSGKIRRAVLRMRDLTDDVLAESRLVEAAAAFDLQPVEFGAVVATQVEERQEASRHVFRLNLGGQAMVRGDHTLLGILVANLLDNAVKYSPPDGEIRVDLVQDAGTATLAIADDGPGVPPQEAERVFEKFYRAESVAPQPGIGLGLYLVRKIARGHGGEVSVASKPGKGAVFTVTLPLAAGQTTET
ncbi:MAG: ATP-binding protein [Solirubrobacterales bacterium]